MTPQEPEAILNGTHGDPFSVLGPHQAGGRLGGARVPSAGHGCRGSWPDGAVHPMRKTRSEGFFVAALQHDPGHYKLQLTLWNGEHAETEDPYRFPPLISDFDLHIHGEGTQYESYRTMGAHMVECQGVHGRALCGLGAERRSGQRSRRFQRLGRAPASHAAAHRRRLGNLPSGSRRRHQLQVFRACAQSRGFRQQKADPYGFAMRSAAAIRVHRLRSRNLSMERSAVDGGARPQRSI